MVRGYAGSACDERRYTLPPRRSATTDCAARRMLRVRRVVTPRLSRLGGKAGLLDEAAPLHRVLLQQLAELARRRTLGLEAELAGEFDHLPVAEHRPDRRRRAVHRLGAG